MVVSRTARARTERKLPVTHFGFCTVATTTIIARMDTIDGVGVATDELVYTQESRLFLRRGHSGHSVRPLEECRLGLEDRARQRSVSEQFFDIPTGGNVSEGYPDEIFTKHLPSAHHKSKDEQLRYGQSLEALWCCRQSCCRARHDAR